MRLIPIDMRSAALVAALIGGVMSACGGEAALTPAAPSDVATATSGVDALHETSADPDLDPEQEHEPEI